MIRSTPGFACGPVPTTLRFAIRRQAPNARASFTVRRTVPPRKKTSSPSTLPRAKPPGVPRVLPVHCSPLKSRIYDVLKAMIVERRLLPGDRIDLAALSDELGVGRAELTHTLRHFETQKLVQFFPRRGCFVRQFSKLELIAIFELREVLEGLATRKATEFISDDEILQLRKFFAGFDPRRKITDLKAYAHEDRSFHAFLLNIGATELLRDLLDSYNVITFSYQYALTEGLVRPPEETITEHLAIIDAVCRRQPLEAEQHMRTHLGNSSAALLQAVRADEARAAAH
jgi:DNA-binding GntR family transcriptional regulator